MKMSGMVSSWPVLIFRSKSCEPHGCHLGGYKDGAEAMQRKLKEAEAFLMGNPKYRTWYNIDDADAEEAKAWLV